MIKKILALAALLILFYSCAPAQSRTSRMRLRVVDGPADTPIANARVVVPETGESFYTDEDGLTPLMELPVIPDSEYDRLLKSSLGRITFIVFAEGYTPCLLLYVRTGRTRGAADVLMFPDDGTLPVFTVIEAPPTDWSEELVSLYR